MKIRNIEWWILGLLGVLAFVLSFSGYTVLFSEIGIERNYLDILFLSIKVFTMDIVDGYTSPLPWQLEISRWLSPALFLFVAAKAILYLIRREFKFALLKYKKDHIIISALNTNSRHLISDLLSKNETVVVISPIANLTKMDTLETNGAIFVEGDLSSESFLVHIAAHRAKYIVFMDKDDDTNISAAYSFFQFIEKYKSERIIPLYTHVSDDFKLNELNELNFFEKLNTKNNQNCEVHLFSSIERASRVLFLKYSPDLFRRISSPKDPPVNIAIIGSNTLSQSLILRLIRLGHYANLKKIKITLFQDEINIIDPLSKKFRNLTDYANFTLINNKLDLFDAQEFELLHQKENFDAVYLLSEDESLTSSIMHKLSKVKSVKKLDLVIALYNPEGLLNKHYHTKEIGKLNIHKFDLVNESFTQEALLTEQLDELAKIIHKDYLSGIKTLNPNKSSHKDWKNLSLDFRNQNREQADHIYVKLRALGYPQIKMEDIVFTDDVVNLLAEMEHNRWWSNMTLSGWTQGEKRDDSNKIHTDLIPYDKLDIETQKYDKDAVLNIPKLIKKIANKQ